MIGWLVGWSVRSSVSLSVVHAIAYFAWSRSRLVWSFPWTVYRLFGQSFDGLVGWFVVWLLGWFLEW